MSKASDINNLYARFGGSPDTYQEITQQKSLSEARKRWPLLRAINGEELSAQEAVVPVSFSRGSQRKTNELSSALPEGGHELEEDVTERVSKLDLDAMHRPSFRRRVAPLQESSNLRRDDEGDHSDLQRVSGLRGDSRGKARAAVPVSRQSPSREVGLSTRKDRAISDVFSKLAGRKEPRPEPVKPLGIFGALRKVVRK